MSRIAKLGHISPVVTHLITFLLGASLLLQDNGYGTLGSWQGILISLPKTKIPEESAYVIRNRVETPCLLHEDPFFVYKQGEDTPGILLPRDVEFVRLAKEIVSRKVKLSESNEGLSPCPDLRRRVHYD